MMDFFDLQAQYRLLLKQREIDKVLLKSESRALSQTKKHRDNLLKARAIITEEAELAQKNFSDRINSLVTMVIQSVFSHRDLRFELKLERKANRLEARPVIYENGEEYDDIKADTGGSIIDLISFSMRIVLWSMQEPPTIPVFILDEPFKQIGKGRMLDRTGAMLKEISRKLDIQIIIVTHEPQLQQIADKAFFVDLKDGVSVITEDKL